MSYFKLEQAAASVVRSMRVSGDHRRTRLVYLAKHEAVERGLSSEKIEKRALEIVARDYRPGWLE